MTHANYDISTRLGDLIRTQRDQLGLSAAALARKADLSPPTVRAIEAGDADPQLSTLLVIAKALGHDLSDFLRYADL